jgi:hypothetical protein
MKVCWHCGRTNDDGVKYCLGCGTRISALDAFIYAKFLALKAFIQKDEAPKGEDKASESERWRLWLIAWGGVLLVTLVTGPAYVLAAPLFPIGLFVFLRGGEGKAIEGLMGGAWGIGWLLYAALSVVMFVVRKKEVFSVVYVIFCVLLILNLVGCQRLLLAANGLH